MNKTVVLLLLLVLALPAYACALDLPLIGGDKKTAEENDAAPDAQKKKTKFLILFKSGGEISTDNYTVSDKNVIIMMPSGAIYLDKDMVKSIEEVEGVEEETIQSIDLESSDSGKSRGNGVQGSQGVDVEVQAEESDGVDRDDDGHTEQWWQSRINEWKNKKAEAQKRYNEAEGEWAKYDGLLQSGQTSVPTTKQVQKLDEEGKPVFDKNGNPVYEIVEVLESTSTEYDIIRYQDLRGSARVAMDRAEAEIEEADRMLDEEIPDEARQAGAPPGWVR